MAVDGLILHQVLKTITEILPARINKITQPSDSEILFVVRHNTHNYKLLLCVHSQYNRINISKKDYENPATPSGFVMLLRKHLENGVITEITQFGLDRCLRFVIKKNDELSQLKISHLYLELMGKYANLILTDSQDIILDALKRIPYYANSRRIIFAGATYQENARPLRLNPLQSTQASIDLPLMEQFEGFSPLLAKEVEYRLIKGQTFTSIMDELQSSQTIYHYQKSQNYHVLPLTHLEEEVVCYEINEGFDLLYAQQQDKLRVEQSTGNLTRFVRSELKKNLNKLPKLEVSLSEALDCDKWRKYGDLLFSNLALLSKGSTVIELHDFETSTKITIPLEAKLSPKANAQKYYQKYRKGKSAQVHLSNQIDNCQREISYFTLLNQQLEIANTVSAKEIREELVNNHYLRAPQTKKKGKGKQVPKYSSYEIEEVMAYVGQNNLQNNYLTFKLARKDWFWFHCLEIHGAHVVLASDSPNEAQIRFCANLAAYYSKGRYSSSVAVSYTQVKNVKKIPDSLPGLVSISNYKTIYIDPEKPD